MLLGGSWSVYFQPKLRLIASNRYAYNRVLLLTCHCYQNMPSMRRLKLEKWLRLEPFGLHVPERNVLPEPFRKCAVLELLILWADFTFKGVWLRRLTVPSLTFRQTSQSDWWCEWMMKLICCGHTRDLRKGGVSSSLALWTAPICFKQVQQVLKKEFKRQERIVYLFSAIYWTAMHPFCSCLPKYILHTAAQVIKVKENLSRFCQFSSGFLPASHMLAWFW